MPDLEGKSAVITGAASGIGAGSARVFAREGARVALLDREIAQAEEVLAGLPKVDAGEHVAIEIDVGSPESIDAAWGKVDAAFDSVYALANCAGVRGVGSTLDLTLEEWEFIHDVNLRGSFLCAQHAARRMVDAGKGGSIVNIASTSALQSNNRRMAYSSSKAGVLGMTRGMALDLGEFDIRVNAVCPGLTKTGLTAPYFEDPEWVRVATSNIPLKRHAEPIETGEVIAFLASPRSSFVSGVTLLVDGGMSAIQELGGGGTNFSVDRSASS
ncbi:MAG: SDR family oxidoreductase [Actinobacteria bacterium]|nr:SDR family oxidoreductase [Actinomycetota bacterium]